ncbi:hypothetical protein F5877DRAFT_49481, partial [Lentinula edodes]
TKRTKKVGITGKYDTASEQNFMRRTGAEINIDCSDMVPLCENRSKKMEISQHARYTCPFCGKMSCGIFVPVLFSLTILYPLRDSVKRQAVGIWSCGSCRKVIAGGAWSVSTTAAATVRSTVRRLRELTDRLFHSSLYCIYDLCIPTSFPQIMIARQT